MWETMGVLFVFFILLGIGLVFYSAVEQKNARLQQDESSQLLAIERALRIAQLPELECPTSLEIKACIDGEKAKLAKVVFESHQAAYFDLFGFSNITLQTVGGPEDTLYAYTGERMNKRQVLVPVSVYNPVDKTYAFGVLKLTVFT